jgi:hypothetical protein
MTRKEARARATRSTRRTEGVASTPVQSQRTIINRAELRENTRPVHDMGSSTRAPNTTAAYVPKQEEFRQFCQRKQCVDGDTVTEDKLLLWLAEEVTERPLRMQHGKQADPDSRLSWRSVRLYVSAITDLYQTQKALGVNNHPSPREATVREFVKTVRRQDAACGRDSYADKGRDTLLDDYSESELKSVTQQLWSHTTTGPEAHLRTLVDFLLGHYMLTHGGDRRQIKISDLFTFEFTDEGPSRCMPLIVTRLAGKQNQYGRLEIAGALRNRDPSICILGAVAFYLLYRWDLSSEGFPDFRTRPSWYDIKVIKGGHGAGSDPAQPVAYNTQRDWITRAFTYAGITSNKKTYVGRSSGVKIAELKGINESQIRCADRWNRDQMTSCYLNSLPRKFMRTMAGHPATIGTFEIYRARTVPPESLLRMVWPELDQWRGRFGPAHGQTHDLVAAGVIELLLYLREVILQDSAVLMPLFPDSAVWSHPVFRHPEYRAFAREVSDTVGEDGRPSQLTILTQTLPTLTNYLTASEGRILGQVSGISEDIRTVRQEISVLTNTVDTLYRLLLNSGIIQLQLSELAQQPSQQPPQQPSPPQQSQPPLLQPTPQQPPKHRMSRRVNTVEGLWAEWMTGLPGQPSIQSLDMCWGSRWRSGRRAELQWYSLRREVIQEVRRVMQVQRLSEEAAVYALGLEQRQACCSLDLFCKRLRAGRKVRAGAT